MATSPAENIATLPVSEAAVHVMTTPAVSRAGDILTCPNPSVMVHTTSRDLAAYTPPTSPPPPSYIPPSKAPVPPMELPPSSRRSAPMTMDIDNLSAPPSRGGVVKSQSSGISTILFFVGIAAVVTIVGFVAVWAWGPEKQLKRTIAAAPSVSFSLAADAPPEPPPAPVTAPPPVATTDDSASAAPSAAPARAAAPSPKAKKAPAPKPSSRQKH